MKDVTAHDATPHHSEEYGASRQSKPRLLFINRSYWPDAEATGQLLTELCENLASDFAVSVIAGSPNANPSGSGFVRQGTEVHNGVTIHRVAHTRFGKRHMPGRAVNLASFLTAAAWKVWKLSPPDIVITETDPFLLACIGQSLKRRTDCRFVAYLQDIYPDVAVAVGKVREGWLTKAIRRVLSACYRRADRVVVLSEDMRRTMERFGVSPDCVVSIPNWVDTDHIQPLKAPGNSFRSRFQLADSFVVMHSGNMGLSQQLETVIDAAAELQDETEIRFLLVGDGARRRDLERQSNDLRLSNLSFMNYQPRDELSHSLSAADVQLICTSEGAIECLMPSKLYGILAAGTPIIAVTPSTSELASIVQCHQVGLTVPPEAPQQLADAVRSLKNQPELVAEMGKRARQLAVEQFDRSIAMERFRKLFRQLSGVPTANGQPAATSSLPRSMSHH